MNDKNRASSRCIDRMARRTCVRPIILSIRSHFGKMVVVSTLFVTLETIDHNSNTVKKKQLQLFLIHSRKEYHITHHNTSHFQIDILK